MEIPEHPEIARCLATAPSAAGRGQITAYMTQTHFANDAKERTIVSIGTMEKPLSAKGLSGGRRQRRH